jgi:ferredoxin-nitrite reductase
MTKILSALEQLKSEIDPYAGREVFDRLAQGTVEDITPQDDIVMRWHGMYRQRPLEAGLFMLRLKLPNGALTAAQAETAASLAERYSGGKISLTTRQNIEFHYITLADLPVIFAELEAVNLRTLGACGDQVRNVVGCPVTDISADELINTIPLANEITAAFLANPQFANLPRKFKIALSGGCGCVPYDINDLGLVAAKNAAGEIGFAALVGGGLSVQPAYAVNAGVWIPQNEVIEFITQLVQIFKEYGNRENRGRARVKHIIADKGVDWLRGELELRLGRKLIQYDIPIPQPSRRDHSGVHRQREYGLFYIGIPVPAGIITAGQLRTLAKIAAEDGKGNIRFTHLQNIILTDINTASVQSVLDKLKAINLPVSDISSYGNTAICVGKIYCMKAITHTKEHILPILDSINDPLFGNEVSFRISGCPNGCSGNAIADISLRGSLTSTDTGSEECFDLLVGGGHSLKPSFARRISSKIKPEELTTIISDLLHRYRVESLKNETFSDYAQRVLWLE